MKHEEQKNDHKKTAHHTTATEIQNERNWNSARNEILWWLIIRKHSDNYYCLTEKDNYSYVISENRQEM